MPWKGGYTISDERSLLDAELRWPGGARCCVGVTVDLSVAPGPEGIRAADLATPTAHFALHEGLEEAAGRRPSGWFSLPRQGDAFAGGSVSPHTMDLLIEAGFAYFGNGLADDIPHWWVTD